MKNSLPLINGKLHVDNSLLELLACPRKLKYNQIDKRVPMVDHQALSFGSAIHLALECRYKRFEPLDDLALCESAQMAVLERHFALNPPPEGDHRDLNFAIEIAQQYNSLYRTEPFNLLQFDTARNCPHCQGKSHVGYAINGKEPCTMCDSTGFMTKMVELPFALDFATIEGIPVVYTGKIDLPTSWNGDIYIGDNKTTSQLGPSYFDQFRMSSQLVGYTWAFQQTTGQRPKGFFVNAIRTKEKTAKMITGAASKSEAAKWWAESFLREREYVDQWRLDEWKENTTAKIEELLWHNSRGVFPMKTNMCAHYGRCQYYDVCYYPTQNRADILAGNAFKDNEWTPLTKK